MESSGKGDGHGEGATSNTNMFSQIVESDTKRLLVCLKFKNKSSKYD